MLQKSLFSGVVLQTILEINSPWLKNPEKIPVPQKFYREAFFSVSRHLFAYHNMAVLIKGPRRVGKTEIQKQCITSLIQEHSISPQKVLYLSLDDTQIQIEDSKNRFRLVSDLLDAWAQKMGYEKFEDIDTPAFCFLDEVQMVEDWARLLKNKIDRVPSVRFILSGSAAHSIFQKSLEILLGRVIAENLTPFSFREFLAFKNILSFEQIQELQSIQIQFETDFSVKNLAENLEKITTNFEKKKIQDGLSLFLEEGGFPQMWQIDSQNILEKARMLDENYVKKVTLEDLMLLRDIKKPELFERLLRHLFARPGQEYNQNKVANDLGTTTITLSDGIKLLKQTDLLVFVERFSEKAEPLKRQNLKIYPVDLSLSFAMSKKVPSLDEDEAKGMVAETLVAQTLFRLKTVSQLGFLQQMVAQKRREVDFFVRSDTREMAVEVKFQNNISEEDIDFLRNTVYQKKLEGGIVVVPENFSVSGTIFAVPLWAFCLLA